VDLVGESITVSYPKKRLRSLVGGTRFKMWGIDNLKLLPIGGFVEAEYQSLKASDGLKWNSV
jgi:hypothetical protein